MGSNPSTQTVTSNPPEKDQEAEFEGEEDERPAPNHMEPGYPPPCPPPNKKTEFVNKDDFRKTDEFARKIKADDFKTLQDLVNKLIEPFHKDLQKVRSIFVWIGAQPFSQRDYPRPLQINSPLGYLKRMAHGTMSYAEIFTVMCRLADIPCIMVSGIAKSSVYEVGESDLENLYNMWNAVYICGGWRLVFPLWALRAIVGMSTGNWPGNLATDDDTHVLKEMVITTVKEYYFLTDPEEFVYRCLPDSMDWQLLKEPFSRDKFIEVPYLRPKFFEYDLHQRADKGVIFAEKGVCEIVLTKGSENVWLVPSLLQRNEEDNIDASPSYTNMHGYTACFNENMDFNFSIRLPKPGVYKLQIIDYDQEWVCSYKLISNGPPYKVHPFPADTALGFGPCETTRDAGVKPVSNAQGKVEVKPSDETELNFDLVQPLDIQVELVHRQLNYDNLQKSVSTDISDCHFSVKIFVPEDGEFALLIYARMKDSTEEFVNVCNYLLTTLESKANLRLPEIDSEDKIINDLTASEKTSANRKTIPLSMNTKKSFANVMITSDRNRNMRNIGKRQTKSKGIQNLNQLDHADNKDIKIAAKEREEIQKIVKSLQAAIGSRDLEILDKTIDEAKKSEYKERREVSKDIYKAEETAERIRRIKRHAHCVLEMNQKTISEIHRYQTPTAIIHDIMKATYLLLGETWKTVQKWENVQNLTRKSGMQSLMIRIKTFDSVHVDVPTVNRVLNLLNKYDQDTATVASAGAGTFYVWATNISNDVMQERGGQ